LYSHYGAQRQILQTSSQHKETGMCANRRPIKKSCRRDGKPAIFLPSTLIIILLSFAVLLSFSAIDARAETYQFVLKWGGWGLGDGKFDSATGVAVSPSGKVYVTDIGNHRIQKFDSRGNFITKWGSLGTGDGQFKRPMGIALDSLENVYVTEEEGHRIQKFDSNGNFITKWGSEGSGNSQFSYPQGLALDSSGNVYVADEVNNRIQKFDSNGNFITKWGGPPVGSADGQLNYPVGIAIDSSGHIYVGNWGNHRIQKFDSNGNFIARWGSYGSADGQFMEPYLMAVDSEGNVYVADQGNHRIQKFDSNGNFMAKFGSPYGSADGQLNSPEGVAVDSSGYVYVGDSGNYRMQKFVLPCVPEPANMVAWWRGGNNPFDAVAANNGTLVNGVTYAAGKVGQAFSFDGTNQYVEVPNSSLWNFSSNDFSIEFWLNFDGRDSTFVGHDNGGGTQNKWIFYLNNGNLAFHLNGPSTNSVNIGSFPYSFTAGQWYHLALTRSGSTYTFYVNGVSLGAAVDTQVIPDASAPLTIGQAEGLGYLHGLMDEIAIFNRALSAEEIAGIYNAGNAGVCPLPPVPLSEGWNFISFPKVPPADMATAFSDVSAHVGVVWGYDNENQWWTKWKPTGGPSNTLLSADLGKGYWVYMNTSGSITMEGWARALSNSVNLSEGWNLVGYLGTNDADAGIALNRIADKWDSMWGWMGGTWYGKYVTLALPAPIQPLSLLNQGRAYWIKIKPGAGPVDWVQ
jgi:sugar lactone lactonase YvrE